MEINDDFVKKFGWDDFKTHPAKENRSRMTAKEEIIAAPPVEDYEDCTFAQAIEEKFNEEFPAVQEHPQPGFIVIHQNVGNLSPQKADAFCERVRDYFTNSKQWRDFKEKYPHWSFILLPSRTEESYVEVFHEGAEEREMIASEIVTRNSLAEIPLQDSPGLEGRVKQYILMMLGAPVVNVELSETALYFCYKHSLNIIHDHHARALKETSTHSYRAQSEDFLCAGALAHAMMILGRIRMQNGVPNDGRVHLDPQQLYDEGKEKLTAWKASLEIKKDA